LLVGQYVANGTSLLDAGDLFGALVWFGEALELDQADPAARETHQVRLAATLRRCPRLLRMWFPDDNLKLVRLSPDGNLILTVSAAGEAHLLDAATGKDGRLLPQREAIRFAAFGPDGRRLVVAGTNKSARLVDTATRQAVGPVLRHDGEVTFAAFSADGNRLVTVGADKAARVWDVQSGKPLSKPMRHDAEVVRACLSPDGRRVATATAAPPDKGELLLWDADTGGVLAKTALAQRPRLLAFGADGKHLFTVFQMPVAQVFKADASLKPLARREWVRGVSDDWLDPATGHVVVARDETAQIWDLLAGQPSPFAMAHRADVNYVAFSGDGRSVLTAAWDRTARVWDAADGQPRTPPLRHGQRVMSAALSRNGRRLFTRDEDQVLRLWDVAPRETDVAPLVFKQSGLFRVLSSDGRHMLLSTKQALRVVELGKEKVTGPALPHTGPVTHGAFSPDGRLVLYADREAVTVSDLKGKPVGPPHKFTGGVRQARFTPDGTRVVVLDDLNQVHLWDPAGPPVVATVALKFLPNGVLAAGPQGRRLAALLTKQVLRVFDPANPKRALPLLKHDTAVVAAEFSPDGKYLATACTDGTAHLWDLTSAASAAPPLTHGRQLQRLAFSRDGRRLATGGDNGVVRVWDVATGQALTPSLQHGTAPTQLSFSPDGLRLLTADKSGARVWDLRPDDRPPADLVRLAYLLAGQHAHAAGESLVPVERARLRQLWKELSGKYPGEFTTP
jgi:WD40 repeat protein